MTALLCFVMAALFAADVRLEWDPSPSTNVLNYSVVEFMVVNGSSNWHYRASSVSTSAVVAGVPPGVHIYAVLAENPIESALPPPLTTTVLRVATQLEWGTNMGVWWPAGGRITNYVITTNPAALVRARLETLR